MFRKVSRDTLEAVARRIKGANDVNNEALFESMVDVTYAQYKFGRDIDFEDRSLLMYQASAVASNRPTEALASVISFTFVVYSHYKHS